MISIKLLSILLVVATASGIGVPVVVDATVGDSIHPGHSLYGVERFGENIRSVFSGMDFRGSLAIERCDEALHSLEINDTSTALSLARECIAMAKRLSDEARDVKGLKIAYSVLSKIRDKLLVIREKALKLAEEMNRTCPECADEARELARLAETSGREFGLSVADIARKLREEHRRGPPVGLP